MGYTKIKVEKRKDILVLGAYDRFNYGDILFPYVVEYHINRELHDWEIKYYGVVESNLEHIGGKKTLSIKQFYKACSSKKGRTIVIIAGGETVGVSWDSIFTSLSRYGTFLRKLFRTFKLKGLFNSLTKLLLKGRGEFVFSIDKDILIGVEKIIFNSVGANSINVLSNRFLLTSILNKVDYLAVREPTSQKNLDDIDVKSVVYPDSAIIISKIFPVKELLLNISTSVNDYVNNNKYIFFQVNLNIANRYTEEIAISLNRLKKEYDVNICFCPIGVAHGHNDIEALELISSRLDFEVMFFKDVNIWDIMLLIAKSNMYIGSSLHGVITAMSFAIPYIGINPAKLDSYLATWGADNCKVCTNFEDICTKYGEIILMDKSILEALRDLQIESSLKSFREIISLF